MTEAEKRAFQQGFIGPRPGSNYWPMVVLKFAGETILGQRINDLCASGELIATPVEGELHTLVGNGDTLPDVECTHHFVIADSVR